MLRVGKNIRYGNPLYGIWNKMIHRCYDEKRPEYKYYGGRGIKVCDRWLGKDGFDNFVEDMSPRPEGLTLDRTDNNGDYCPENCRWATRKQQSQNRNYFVAEFCSVPGCKLPHHGKGLCSRHYIQKYRADHPDAKEKSRRWLKEHPEKVKEYNRKQYLKRKMSRQ